MRHFPTALSMQTAAPHFVVHLVGPGGAGKTAAGPLLAGRLGWRFVDLDREFIAREGDVATYMAVHGYAGYTLRNVAVYREVMNALTASTVFALSSGFMTYAATTDPQYAVLRQAIEHDALTVLLLPSFDLEACVHAIVQRQLARPYLAGNRANEEARIRERFPAFMALQCARFDSSEAPRELAMRIEQFVRARCAA
ncbi:shikimate kinase [Variovorax boronicumulans]|uniref:shikimate kinase n=1 Tax=Variovorax boronicumulans TaxID=436515 RepID=UPI0027813BC8|nr:shikimate kinase [Variovorax boronicumulans]MDQ0041869.1 shikimate kinase [Variovorax boronicumulans]